MKTTIVQAAILIPCLIGSCLVPWRNSLGNGLTLALAGICYATAAVVAVIAMRQKRNNRPAGATGSASVLQ